MEKQILIKEINKNLTPATVKFEVNGASKKEFYNVDISDLKDYFEKNDEFNALMNDYNKNEEHINDYVKNNNNFNAESLIYKNLISKREVVKQRIDKLINHYNNFLYVYSNDNKNTTINDVYNLRNNARYYLAQEEYVLYKSYEHCLNCDDNKLYIKMSIDGKLDNNNLSVAEWENEKHKENEDLRENTNQLAQQIRTFEQNFTKNLNAKLNYLNSKLLLNSSNNSDNLEYKIYQTFQESINKANISKNLKYFDKYAKENNCNSFLTQIYILKSLDIDLNSNKDFEEKLNSINFSNEIKTKQIKEDLTNTLNVWNNWPKNYKNSFNNMVNTLFYKNNFEILHINTNKELNNIDTLINSNVKNAISTAQNQIDRNIDNYLTEEGKNFERNFEKVINTKLIETFDKKPSRYNIINDDVKKLHEVDSFTLNKIDEDIKFVFDKMSENLINVKSEIDKNIDNFENSLHNGYINIFSKYNIDDKELVTKILNRDFKANQLSDTNLLSKYDKDFAIIQNVQQSMIEDELNMTRLKNTHDVSIEENYENKQNLVSMLLERIELEENIQIVNAITGEDRFDMVNSMLKLNTTRINNVYDKKIEKEQLIANKKDEEINKEADALLKRGYIVNASLLIQDVFANQVKEHTDEDIEKNIDVINANIIKFYNDNQNLSANEFLKTLIDYTADANKAYASFHLKNSNINSIIVNGINKNKKEITLNNKLIEFNNQSMNLFNDSVSINCKSIENLREKQLKENNLKVDLIKKTINDEREKLINKEQNNYNKANLETSILQSCEKIKFLYSLKIQNEGKRNKLQDNFNMLKVKQNNIILNEDNIFKNSLNNISSTLDNYTDSVYYLNDQILDEIENVNDKMISLKEIQSNSKTENVLTDNLISSYNLNNLKTDILESKLYHKKEISNEDKKSLSDSKQSEDLKEQNLKADKEKNSEEQKESVNKVKSNKKIIVKKPFKKANIKNTAKKSTKEDNQNQINLEDKEKEAQEYINQIRELQNASKQNNNDFSKLEIKKAINGMLKVIKDLGYSEEEINNIVNVNNEENAETVNEVENISSLEAEDVATDLTKDIQINEPINMESDLENVKENKETLTDEKIDVNNEKNDPPIEAVEESKTNGISKEVLDNDNVQSVEDVANDKGTSEIENIDDSNKDIEIEEDKNEVENKIEKDPQIEAVEETSEIENIDNSNKDIEIEEDKNIEENDELNILSEDMVFSLLNMVTYRRVNSDKEKFSPKEVSKVFEDEMKFMLKNFKSNNQNLELQKEINEILNKIEKKNPEMLQEILHEGIHKIVGKQSRIIDGDIITKERSENGIKSRNDLIDGYLQGDTNKILEDLKEDKKGSAKVLLRNLIFNKLGANILDDNNLNEYTKKLKDIINQDKNLQDEIKDKDWSTIVKIICQKDECKKLAIEMKNKIKTNVISINPENVNQAS